MADLNDSNLRHYKPEETSRAATNGGRPTFTAYVSGQLGNVFPLVSSVEREAGLKDAIKIFLGASSANASPMLLSKFLSHKPVTGKTHRLLYCEGTATDTQATFFNASSEPDTGYRRYAARSLFADVAAGARSFEIELFSADEKSGTTAVFQDGDRIQISNKESWDSAAGNTEEMIIGALGSTDPEWAASTVYAADFLLVPTTPNTHYYKVTTGATSGTTEPTWPTDGSSVTLDGVTYHDEGVIASSGVTPHATLDRVTVTTTSGALDAYTVAAGTAIASVIEIGTIEAEIVSCAVTSAGDGDLDDSAIEITNQGLPQDTITLTFTSATEFTAAAGWIGTITGGDTTTDYAPLHPVTGLEIFNIPSTAWSGTFAASDTVILVLAQCAAGIWAWREIPAATAALSNISVDLVLKCESN